MEANAMTKKSFLVRYRYWILGAAVVLFLPPLSFIFQFTGDNNFCGVWCPRMFFVWREGTTTSAYFAGFLRSYMGVVVVFGMLASTFFFGRYWCGHLCPIGGVTEIGSRLIPKSLKIDFSSMPASSFRYGYLSIYFIAPAIGVGSLCCNYCNFAVIPRLFGAAFVEANFVYFLRTAGLINLGLIVALGFLAKGGRAYCNLLCPIGALDALANRLGIRLGKRMIVSAPKCNGCGLCKEVCPTWSIDVEEVSKIDHLSCISCRICEDQCPYEAIAYGKDEG